MSTKIKALNEEEVSLDDDQDVNGKPSKEAQEELSILKYNEALGILREGRKKDAVRLLEEIVSADDLKQLSVPQQKLQLGCLKVLGDLYRDGECKNLERCKVMYERALYYDQAENNVNFWYRLGKVCYEMGDLYSAHVAFGQALKIRPGHWSCLEHMVTVCYSVQDYTGCLNYCAMGLALDAGFLKGRVFQELVYSVFPELKKDDNEDKNENQVPTNVIPQDYQNACKRKYLDELKNLQDRSRERNATIQRHISEPASKIHFSLKSFSIEEVLHVVLFAYENSFAHGTPKFHKAIDVSWSLHADNGENEDNAKSGTAEESQTEEESQSGIRRSRSSSDDKENNTATVDSASQQEVEGDKCTNDNGSECQPTDTQAHQVDPESGNKKKKGRDVKWWQMEGKRRSQRVRGHLMPTSPDKAKKESSFADQLKNLIPASLLGDDGSNCERESAKASEKCGWQKKPQPSYFGSKEEETHVKQLLSQMNGSNLADIVNKLIEFLTLRVKVPWPSQLRELFLDLYQYFRSFVRYPNVNTTDTKNVVKDAFACICYVEIILEKHKVEFSSREKDFSKLCEKEIFLLEDCITSVKSIDKDLILRVKWLMVRRLLQMAITSNDNEVNSEVCLILSEMEKELRGDPITVWTVNETSNLICFESVSEKAVGIAKMQNSQVVTDLYQSQQYESLIGVLQSCINFAEVEKRDLLDIFYYTVSLFRTNCSDCIHHCLNLINQAIRFQDSNSLTESLVLLEQIWDKMGSRFTLQDKRSTVGTLLKILVACERKAPSQESVLTIPWCILHSVMFSLEREEPAIYLEEDTVPNSILLLQMAHECMSRTEKCCVDGGKLMLFTMKEILKVKKLEEYFAYEETRHCMEQAIFCMYSHPGKKSKVKGLKDHNSIGTMLTWNMCPTLYHYYYPDELPEFDSLGSIGTEVETLFQRFLEIMPPELSPANRQKQIQEAIAKSEELDGMSPSETFPTELQDIYYLIADYCFKSKEWSKAVTYYTWDLAINPSRFDSWAAIALCLAESINTTLNTSDDIVFKDLLNEAQSTSFCFHNALKVDPSNIKLRIEFGSFVYAMHAYCSRLMKQQQATDIDMDRFHMIEKAKDEFLKSSCKCFELIAKNPEGANDSTETVEDELWIHHYMLGKINEKMKEDAEDFLKQYELAGKLLHDQGAPYPSKMNYYSPPELAIEALEIYYRIHASILSLVENVEYSLENEKLYLQYIRRQENSPFIKNKQSKESGESKKGRKAAEDAVSRKDMAEITTLVNELVEQTEKMIEQEPAESAVTSSAVSTTSSDDETSTDSQSVKLDQVPKPPIGSFSLAEFQKRLLEKEQREEKLATEAKKAEEASSTKTTGEVKQEEDIYEGLQLESNHFYPTFKDVKYGAVIALCLKAMEECISRYPSHFKSYYRLSHSYVVFVNDAKRAKEYLMGSPALSQRKITGLFGERKPTNLFNGIWRNPIDDVDRPGSFSYHMNKAMQLLLGVLSKLNDHALLADIGIYLTKVPDNEKKYLTNPDREMFCLQAWSLSVAAVKRKIAEATGNIDELGIEIFETYTKFQKHNPRGHPISTCLHDVYKLMLTSRGVNDDIVTVEHALRYYSAQHLMMKQNASRNNSKGSGQATGDTSKTGGDGPPPRKRGRRGRQASQEATAAAANTSAVIPQELDSYGMAFAAALHNNLMDMHKNPPSVLPFPYLGSLPGSNLSGYPTMSIDPAQILMNPMSSLKHIEAPSKAAPTPPPGLFDFSKAKKPSVHTSQSAHSSKQHQTTPTLVTPKEMTAEKERVPINAPEQGQVKQTGQRKVSKQEVSKDANKYPPLTQPNTIRINTSPYKAQNAVVEPPPQFSFNKKGNQGLNERKTPPAAHSQTTPKRAEESKNDDSDVVVIDLTVKTPEKDKDKCSNPIEPSTRPVVRNPVFGPPARHHYVDLRAIAMNPVPGLNSSRAPPPMVRSNPPIIRGNAPVRSNEPYVRQNASSARTNEPNIRPGVMSARTSEPNLRPGVPSARISEPNVRQNVSSARSSEPIMRISLPSIRPLDNTSRSTNASNLKSTAANPRPVIANPRPVNPRPGPSNVRSNAPTNDGVQGVNLGPRMRLNSSGNRYPLPPKKKHQQLMLSMPPSQSNNDDDDVEDGEDNVAVPQSS